MNRRKICVIPARMASSRFPGKPLEKLLGLSLIGHIFKRCSACKGFDEVIVATCDQEIINEISSLGGQAVMTKDSHERCTDRVAEALTKLDNPPNGDDLVIMVQGDEVLVNEAMLSTIIGKMEATNAPALNLISRLYTEDTFHSPHTVKVVTRPDSSVIYMSRSMLPSPHRNNGETGVYQQTGIIGFTADFLKQFSELSQTPLEIAESVDMLRVIEHGLTLQSVKTEIETVGVDTPEDLRQAEGILKEDKYTSSYL